MANPAFRFRCAPRPPPSAFPPQPTNPKKPPSKRTPMPQPRDTELTLIDELIQNGDWKEALAACHARLSQNPDCLATQRHGLTSAWCLGCFDDAIGFADRILAQQPFDAPV